MDSVPKLTGSHDRDTSHVRTQTTGEGSGFAVRPEARGNRRVDTEEHGDEVGPELRRGALGSAACDESGGERHPLALRPALLTLIGCAVRTAALLARDRIRQPRRNVGREIRFGNGAAARVYRETVIERPPPADPAVLVVGFRLRHVHGARAHALFRLESELNTVLFAGFSGLVSKLWLRHDEDGLYRGVYQWDGPESAVAYVHALWWALALVSEPDSIHYAVLPGLDRDQLLADPELVACVVARPGGWWRPVRAEPASRSGNGGGRPD